MPSYGIRAFRSWLTVASTSVTATGRVCSRIPLRRHKTKSPGHQLGCGLHHSPVGYLIFGSDDSFNLHVLGANPRNGSSSPVLGDSFARGTSALPLPNFAERRVAQADGKSRNSLTPLAPRSTPQAIEATQVRRPAYTRPIPPRWAKGEYSKSSGSIRRLDATWSRISSSQSAARG